MVIDLSANCVARWKMNEDTASTDVGDTSGNGHNGMSERNTNLLHASSGNPPWLNGAFDFNGSGDYIRVADDDVWDFVGFRLGLFGSYSNFMKFFGKLESSPFLIEIQDLTIKKLTESEIKEYVNIPINGIRANLSIRIFYVQF